MWEELTIKINKKIFKIDIPLKEEAAAPLTTVCYYCKEEQGDDCVRDHDHVNGVFRLLTIRLSSQ